MKITNRLFLFIMIGMLFQAAPNVLCAAADESSLAAEALASKTQEIIDNLRGIRAGDLEEDELPEGCEALFDLNNKGLEKSLKMLVAFEIEYTEIINGLRQSKIPQTLGNLKALSAEIRDAELEIGYFVRELSQALRDAKVPDKRKKALFERRIQDLHANFIALGLSMDVKTDHRGAQLEYDAKIRKWKETASALEIGVYEQTHKIWQAAGDGLAESEALQMALARAARHISAAFVAGARQAAQDAGEEVVETLKKSVAEVDVLTKKVTTLVNTLSGGVNSISNAGSFGLLKMGASLLAVATGGVGLWLGAREVRKYLDKPDIVKETNIPTIRQRLGQLLSGVVERGEVFPKLTHVILNEPTFHALERIKLALQGTKNYGGFFTNCLLWGPSGTGKTMSAKALANEVDCYWMLFSGSSLMQLSRAQAIQEIDAIFEFASRQSKPVVIIIDEADPMLEKRTDLMDRDTMAVMTHFMQKTGSKRNDIMFIAMTNRPAAFDPAVLQRFPDQIEIALPGVKERSAILRFNLCRLLEKQRVSIEVFTEELIQWVAEQTEGMSGRQIEDFVIFLYQEYNVARQLSVDAELNEEMVKKVLAHEIHKKYVSDHGFLTTGEVALAPLCSKVA